MNGTHARECECLTEKRVAKKIPERFRRASLLDFPPGVQEPILAWLGCPGDGLLLTGAAGTGKTHLAAAITRTLVMISFPVTFARFAEVFAELRETYRLNLDERAVLDRYFNARILVLDDLGAGSLSDHERRSTLEIFDQRLNSKKATVVTTNWGLEEVAVKMDERIASRLASFTQLELAGSDRRLPR